MPRIEALFCLGGCRSTPRQTGLAVHLPASPLTMQTGRRKQYGPTSRGEHGYSAVLVTSAIHWRITGFGQPNGVRTSMQGALSEVQHEL